MYNVVECIANRLAPGGRPRRLITFTLSAAVLERAQPTRGFGSVDFSSSQLVQDLLASSCQVGVLLAHLEAHGLYDLVESSDDRRVGNSQLFLDVLNFAFAADADFDKLQLLARQARQPPEREVALQG